MTMNPVVESVPRPALRYDQLAVASNPRLTGELADATHAYVVVHPGFLIAQIDDMKKRYKNHYFADEVNDGLMAVLNTYEGSYDQYLEQLTELFDHLHETDDPAPVIMYTERREAYSETYRYPALASPDRAFTIITKEADAAPLDEVSYQQEGVAFHEPQQPGLLYDWLKRSGVNTVHAAGELGLKRCGGIFPACVGTVAIDLMQNHGLTVHGIEQAIYPSFPADLHNPLAEGRAEYWPMAEALHINTVPFPN